MQPMQPDKEITTTTMIAIDAIDMTEMTTKKNINTGDVAAA